MIAYYKTYLAILVLSALTSWALTPWVKKLALHLGAIDVPSERKVHKHPMPRLGGIAIFFGMCLPWIGLYIIENFISITFQNYEKLLLKLVASSVAILLLGVYDDIKGANAKQKFAVQFAVAFFLYASGLQITQLSNPFGDPIRLNWLSMPVTVLWLVGITNAINLLDGIDGLATGVTGSIALSLAIINVAKGNVIVALLTLSLAGACLGFLPYNFFPARIFLGDTGSLFMGFMLAGIGIFSLFKSTTLSFIAVPFLVFALPLYDTFSVILRRARARTPLFSADRSHLHHRLLALGWTHRDVSVFLCFISAFMGGIGVFLTLHEAEASTFFFWTVVVTLLGAVGIASRRAFNRRS